MKILISVFNNLATDQRIEKVCETLLINGYEVELIGNNWRGLPEINRNYPVTRITIHSKSLKMAYPEFNQKLYLYLKRNADKNTILLSNDIDTLLPNYLISKKLQIPLVFDSHEIFTEMPSLQGRFTQKIWRYLEKKIIPNVKYMMTANPSYAKWFANHYKIQTPVVINNFPKRRLILNETEDNSTKIILYQGTINPSRGLDKMILAMQKIDNATFLIAGKGPKLEEYKLLVKNLGLKNKIEFLGEIPPKDLQKITENADVGLSIEENNGESYYLSLPNKIADYIQARIPIMVSNFPEMKKIVSQYKVGETIDNHSVEELSSKINIVLENGKSFYLDNLNFASSEICWENEAPKLIALFKKVESDLQ